MRFVEVLREDGGSTFVNTAMVEAIRVYAKHRQKQSFWYVAVRMRSGLELLQPYSSEEAAQAGLDDYLLLLEDRHEL